MMAPWNEARRILCIAGALVAVGLTPARVHAQDDSDRSSDRAEDAKRSNARQLATEASIDYRAGKFDDAYDKFDRAFRLVEVPALGVWSARALRQQNRLVEASERYRDVLRTGAKEDAPPSHQEALRDARAELDELLPLIPNLTIKIENAQTGDITVTLDGTPVESALLGVKQRVDPGEHKIVGKRGNEMVERTVSLSERQNESTTLTFRAGYVRPVTAKADQPGAAEKGLTGLQVAGIASMASGGAFLVGGAVTTALALGKQSDLQKSCPGGDCPPNVHGEVDTFRTFKTLSTLGLVGGAVLGAAGVTLFVVGSPKKESEQPPLALTFTGQGAILRGRF